MERLSGLAPICGPRPRVLILGSFPSVSSLEKGEYYGHPRNHFWILVARALGRASAPSSYPERLAMLSQAGIAVWDVFGACLREGSLDSGIREARPNPLAEFVAANPSIARIGLNGGAAAEEFRRLFAGKIEGVDGKTDAALFRHAGDRAAFIPGGRGCPETGRVTIVRLPSSSPVPTAAYRNAADKSAAWNAFLAER